jgi:hypothetical protein
VKRYWEIIADNLSKAGWNLGWVSAVDSQGRTIWIVDAHRGDGKQNDEANGPFALHVQRVFRDTQPWLISLGPVPRF